MIGPCNLNISLWQKGLIVFSMAVIVSSLVTVNRVTADEAQPPWPVPENARNTKNPIKPSAEGLKAAAQLYLQNCELCHSESGSSTGLTAKNLPQAPANFTDARMMDKATDGELFWKITEGRPPMPSYKRKLSETERWQLVNYLRQLVTRAKYQYLGNKNAR